MLRPGKGTCTSTCSGLGIVDHHCDRLVNIPLKNGLKGIIILVLYTMNQQHTDRQTSRMRKMTRGKREGGVRLPF